MTGRKLIQWLKAQGAKPLDPVARKRLAAAGHPFPRAVVRSQRSEIRERMSEVGRQ
jgi:hypothetical protein